MQWDTFVEKNPGDKLEEAVCLHMHLASQRDMDRMMCEARDLVAVSPMHYHTTEQTTDEDIFSRGSYLKKIHHRWNHPTGGQLRLLRDRWITEAPGWIVGMYHMCQHKQKEKLLGALAQLCMAKQMAPLGEQQRDQEERRYNCQEEKRSSDIITEVRPARRGLQVVRTGTVPDKGRAKPSGK